MKKARWLFMIAHLVSAFQISPPLSKLVAPQSLDKSHVICDGGLTEDQYASIHDSVSLYAPSLPDRMDVVRIPTIMEMDMVVPPTESSETAEEEVAFFKKVEESSWFRRSVPSSSAHSVFHRIRYDGSNYKSLLSYERYCDLERRIASIVQQYLGDRHRHFWLLVDPWLLYDDSLAWYWTRSEYMNALRITADDHLGNPDLVVWSDERTGNI